LTIDELAGELKPADFSILKLDSVTLLSNSLESILAASEQPLTN
jgi:hypothetical protein